MEHSPSPQRMSTRQADRLASLRSKLQRNLPRSSTRVRSHSKEWEDDLRKAMEKSRKPIEEAAFESKEHSQPKDVRFEERENEEKRVGVKYVLRNKKGEAEPNIQVVVANLANKRSQCQFLRYKTRKMHRHLGHNYMFKLQEGQLLTQENQKTRGNQDGVQSLSIPSSKKIGIK